MRIVTHPPRRLQRARRKARGRDAGLILLVALLALIVVPMVMQVTR